MTAQDNNDRPHADSSAPHNEREPTLDVPPIPGHATSSTSNSPDEGGDPSVGAVAAAMAIATAEVAEYKDKALRAVAELENYRRRSDKEREDVAKYAITNFAREMLPVADNLRRALDSQPKAETEVVSQLKAFVSGVELTERELLAAFERFGIKQVSPMGQPFDHNFHQAMFELEDATQPAGTVVQVMQPGYVLKDRLLRPALVAVSKGGAARAASDAAAGEGRNTSYDPYNTPNRGNDGRHYDTTA